ncbi:MAG: hypothetical protein B7Z73_11110 [Planctomycetia bacterium 21-64-5]|nr:MAG: hypothetical protein B7Z73_11110 [Planctomycetia bacterium 21-64-5]
MGPGTAQRSLAAGDHRHADGPARPTAPRAPGRAVLSQRQPSGDHLVDRHGGRPAILLYLALVKERCERDGHGCDDETVARQFRLHLHRGISYLATPGAVRSVSDLVKLTLE